MTHFALGSLPPAWLFALRHILFLGPLTFCAALLYRFRADKRAIVGAIFAFLYGLPMVFVGHVVAVRLGLWTYGGATLHLLGVPADIWFGGVLLWGPVVFLAMPTSRLWIAPAAFVAVNGVMLPMLAPFVTPGPYWFAGVVIIFLFAHVPALYLAQWTWRDIHLPRRAFLLASAFAPLAFFLLPTLIMRAMGGDWSALASLPAWALALAALALGGVAVLGWSGVQMFAIFGGGTPIPLDPTKRLVTRGVYAYLCNPMQTSTALGFAILGLVLGNVWVFSGAFMAVAFVLGMVRWHHRHDLQERFPVGWPDYRAQVPEWLPRWRPWSATTARLLYDPMKPWQARAARLLSGLAPVGLELVSRPGVTLVYDDGKRLDGACAFSMALSHGNFLTMMAGSALLLVIAPLRAMVPSRAVLPTSKPCSG